MAKFILSAFIDEYSDDLDEQVAALERYGIGYVEIRHCDGKNVADFSDEDVARIKTKLDKHGIGVSSVGSPVGKVPLGGDLAEHYKKAERVFEIACALQAKYVRIFSFYLDGAEREKAREKVLSALEEMLRLAEKYGVTLCHENEANIYGESAEQCLDLLTHFKGALRCVFDMGNFVLDGCDPLRAYGILREYIAYFHIKDALSAGAVVPAGKGEARIKEILQAFEKTMTQDTFVTLEPHLQTFAGLNALVGKKFENPYRYEDSRAAFDDAVAHWKNLR